MAESIKKQSWIDPSNRAKNILDFVIEDTSAETIARRLNEVPVSVELSADPFLTYESKRIRSRVLFVTTNKSLLNEDSDIFQHFKNMSAAFDEVHIMLLSNSAIVKTESKRFGKNMWIYFAQVTHWWSLAEIAQNVARRQLEFTDGFRPDVVVALDPFEAGLAGVTLAGKYDRPFQVHITENYLETVFKGKDEENKRRMKMAKYVLARTQSVRAATEAIKFDLEKRFPKISDVGLLPRHYDIKTVLDAQNTNALKQQYPQFSFIILYVGELDSQSSLFRALDASRSVLNAPRIGMVVLGNGPARKEFERRAEILGIGAQVKFESDDQKLISYLKSADILICPDVNQKSDAIVVKAAAAGLPLLIAKTEMREDLFEDGESAFLCRPDDTIEFSQKLVKFLNGNALRTQFSKNAQDIIESRLHEDPEIYRNSYRDSIEVVFGGEDIVHEAEKKALITPQIESNPVAA